MNHSRDTLSQIAVQYAAAACALAEMKALGGEYARQVMANARALGATLDGEGFVVLGKPRGYTATQQVCLDVLAFGALRFEALCQAANILAHKSHRDPTVVRAEIRGFVRLYREIRFAFDTAS